MTTTIDSDVLIARAATAHIKDKRQPNPSLQFSRMFELDEKTWVELRSSDDETIGLYRLSPLKQLRRQ